MVENLLSASGARHLLRFTTARLPTRARAVLDPHHDPGRGSKPPFARSPLTDTTTARTPPPASRRLQMKRLAGLSALAVLIVGVSLPAQEAAAPATNAYYPVKVGSEWTYKVQGGPIKMKITGTEKVGQATGYKIEVTAGNKVSATEVVGVTEKGVFRYNVNGVAAEPPIMFLPADPENAKEPW